MTEARSQDTGAADIDALLRASLAGDRQAFGRIVLQLQSDLRLFIAWRLGRPDEIEDVLQETFLEAYRSLAQYRGEGEVRAWLRGIARHQVAAALRRRRRDARQQRAALDELVDQAALEESTEVEDERLRRLPGCLEGLGQRARRLIEWRYLQGEPLARVAQFARQPKARLSVQLHRIRQRLLACLQGEGAS